MKNKRMLILALILLLPTVTAYSTYYDGTLNLTKIRNVINSIPQKYFRHLDSLYLFEENCNVKNHTIKRDYIKVFLSDNYNGWYYYDYLDFGTYIYPTTTEIYLCNLGKKNTTEIKHTLLHEIGHHYEVTVLKHTTLNETFADTWFWEGI